MPEINATVKDPPTETFGTVRQKIFPRKILILPPPSYPKLFDTRNYCNSKGFPYGSFRHCERKNFRLKVLKLPPPSLIHKFFASGIFLKHGTEGFPYEIFRHCGTKKFSTENLDAPPSPSLIQTFSIPEIIATVKDCPTNLFSTETKIFPRKLNLDTPLLSSNFFVTRNYCNSEGLPYGIFRHCETKNFRRKILMPPLLIQTFSIPEIIATLKDCPTKIFGTLRQKVFDGRS